MSIKTSDLKVGDVLHDVHRERAGNTTMTREGHWLVYVRAVADDGEWADLSWNGNAPKRYRGTVPKGWTRWPKEWIGDKPMRTCEICHAREINGHAEHCEHPRAIAARKRATKATVAP